MVTNINIGKRVKVLRLSQEVSLEKLGEKIGISAAYISQVENGKKPASKNFAQKVAEFFNVDPSYILEQPSLTMELRQLLQSEETAEVVSSLKILIEEFEARDSS